MTQHRPTRRSHASTRSVHTSGMLGLRVWAVGVGLAVLLATFGTALAQDQSDAVIENDVLERAIAARIGADEAVETEEATAAEDEKYPAPPDSLKRRRVVPLTGKSLERAQLRLPGVLENLTEPDFLADADKADAKLAEPRDVAVMRYIEAKEAHGRGDDLVALRLLDQARKMDPNSPSVLQLLGSILYDRGNKSHGAAYLRMAVRNGADEPDVMFRVGADAASRRRWAEVVSVMSRIDLDDPSGDRVLGRLVPFFLGEALLNLGYDRAAIEQFKLFSDQSRQLTRRSDFIAEYIAVDRRRAAVPVLMADANVRLGRFDRALELYRKAAEDPDVKPKAIAAPLIYTLVIMGQTDEAIARYIGYLKHLEDPVVVRELAELFREVDKTQRIVTRAKKLYAAEPQNPAVVGALLTLLDDKALVETFADHDFRGESAGELFPLYFNRAVKIDRKAALAKLVNQVDREPEKADELTAAVIGSDFDAKGALVDFALLPAGDRRTAAGWYVVGMLERAAGNTDRAVESFRRAVRIMPTFVVGRLAMIEMAMIGGDFVGAFEALDKLESDVHPRVPYLRVLALEGAGRVSEALAELTALVTKNPKDIKYLLHKARLHTRIGQSLRVTDPATARRQFEAAEDALVQALRVDDSREDVYAQLFALYGGPLPNAAKFRAVLSRIQTVMPESRTAQLNTARQHMLDEQWLKAESILAALRKAHPDDPEIMRAIVSLYTRTERLKQAEQMLLTRLDAEPADVASLLLLREVGEELASLDPFFQRYEQYLKRMDPSLARDLRLAGLYADWKKFDRVREAINAAIKDDPERALGLRTHEAQLYEGAGEIDRAIKTMDEAIKDSPDDAAALYYMKSWMLNRADKKDKAEQALADAIKAEPDHAPANNDLGYTWADRGEKLDEAEKMIRIAVTADPNSSAYLDSMGWVLYKKGRFVEALQWMQKAKAAPGGDDPTILDHLADVYWRLGDKRNATSTWKEAAANLKTMIDDAKKAAAENPDRDENEPIIDEHYTDLQKSVEAKIKAIDAGDSPPVAPIPDDKPSPKAAVPGD